MTELSKGWDYASSGLDEVATAVRRARITFDGGTTQRAKARSELDALVTDTAALRTYIDSQAAANPGTEWETLKAQKDLLLSAFQSMRSEMDTRITADDNAAP